MNNTLISSLFLTEKTLIQWRPKNTDSAVNLAGTYSFSTNFASTQWIIDSGSTDHICNDIYLFHNIQDISSCRHRITTPDGTSHKVDKKGTIQLTDTLLLKDVLYVPAFQFNLIFVHKMCSDLTVNI